MDSSVAEWLQRARGEKGWTQAELAKVSDVHVNTVKKIESGVTERPSAQVMARLRNALGSTPDPALVREEYDRLTQAALDLIGAYLMRFPEEERDERTFAITRFVLSDPAKALGPVTDR